MRTVTYRLDDLKKVVIPIGKVAENEYTRVQVDAGDIYAEYPHAAAALTVQPPEGEAYPAVVTRDGDMVIWDVKDSDLVAEGDGEIQYTFSAGSMVKKSDPARIVVCRSIIGEGEAPDPLADFIAEAGIALTAIPETIDAALEAAKESGDFDGPPGPQGPEGPAGDDGAPGRDGQDGKDGAPGRDGQDGKDGAPGRDGQDGKDGADGKDGKDGADGADGYSPTASVSKSGKVSTLTVTDKNGTTSVQINDGEDGTGADIIDDTAGSGDTDKTWSADKLSDLNIALNSKQDAPASGATAGKVLGLTEVSNELVPTWVAQPSVPVTDVQVNGTTVLNNGVANVPMATTSKPGAVYSSSNDNIKAGDSSSRTITTNQLHRATFIGLAKAAGADMASLSSVTVGQYPETQKSAISEMLNAPETVSGSTPSITAKAGVRYVCGEVATLTITAPASGIIDVTFDSGSTPTVLTVTPPTGMTMRWIGNDPTALEANKHYEINIMDGCNGMVVAWT